MSLFKASAGVVDITPPVGFPIGGYLLREGLSVGVLDPIRAKIFYISDEENSLIIISFDWIYLFGEWAEGLRGEIGKKIGISAENVILTATHTHSGPGVFASYLGGAENKIIGEDEYLGLVFDKIMGELGKLLESARFVEIKRGKSLVSDLGANRNDPKGFYDNQLNCLVFTDEDGDVILRLVNYGCHLTSLGPENFLFSGDFLGEALDRLDFFCGGTSIFLNGSAGDVSTRFTRKGRGTEEKSRFAEIFADAAFWAQKTAVPLAGDTLSVKSGRVKIKYAEIHAGDEAERELKRMDDEIKKGRETGIDQGEIRRLESLREGAIVRLFISKSSGIDTIFGERKMEAEVSIAVLGGVGLIFFPGEVMSRTAMDLKEEATFPLLISGYANDYYGYLVPSDLRDDGGYESMVTILSDDSIDGIFSIATDLIRG